MGVARPVEPMQCEKSGAIPARGLPMAVCEHPRIIGHIEVPNDWSWQTRKVAGVAPSVERHRVTVQQRRPWDKWTHDLIVRGVRLLYVASGFCTWRPALAGPHLNRHRILYHYAHVERPDLFKPLFSSAR